MTRRTALLALLLAATLASSGRALLAQAPPRLVADNRTQYVAEIYSWNGQAWVFHSRVNPRSWVGIPNAPAGSYWRAVVNKANRDHKVTYSYDAGYRGQQSVWIIQ